MSTHKALTGFALLGQALGNTPEDYQVVVMIVLGQFDSDLKHAFYFKRRGVTASTESDLEIPEVLSDLERTKDFLKSKIQAIFKEAERQDELAKEQAKRDVNQKFAEAIAPHVMGTVTEIAEKYGISKSEVRRMKAAGTLHTLLGS